MGIFISPRPPCFRERSVQAKWEKTESKNNEWKKAQRTWLTGGGGDDGAVVLLKSSSGFGKGDDFGWADESEVKGVEEEDDVLALVVARFILTTVSEVQEGVASKYWFWICAYLRETSLNSPLTKALVLKAGAGFPILASPADMSFSKIWKEGVSVKLVRKL